MAQYDYIRVHIMRNDLLTWRLLHRTFQIAILH